MKKILMLLMTLSIVGMAFAQSTITRDYLGNATTTKVKAYSSHLTDTSATYALSSKMTGFMVCGQVDTGKVSFVVQASAAYSATQSAMKWITVDSLVGATTHSFKSFAGSYPFIRVIRSRWTGGATVYGVYSACYIYPYGAE